MCTSAARRLCCLLCGPAKMSAELLVGISWVFKRKCTLQRIRYPVSTTSSCDDSVSVRNRLRSQALGAENGGAWWKEWQETRYRCHREKAGDVAASLVGERRSLRTIEQQQPSEGGGSRVRTKPFQEEKDKSQSRVPVTALIAWPSFHSTSRT
jgi:hypothetical protein